VLNKVLNRLYRAAEIAEAKDLNALILVAYVGMTLAELAGDEE